MPGGEATLEDFDADRFGRGPVARRIAKTISAQRDLASVVVGIFGAWGYGKTSISVSSGKPSL